MEQDTPKKPKRVELYKVTFLRKAGKREHRKVLAKQLAYDDACAVRDEYAKIGAEEISELQEQLTQAEISADAKLVQQINAKIDNTIGKTENSTFIVDLDRESNENFLKPERPEFPTRSKKASSAAASGSEAGAADGETKPRNGSKKASSAAASGSEAVGK